MYSVVSVCLSTNISQTLQDFLVLTIQNFQGIIIVIWTWTYEEVFKFALVCL